MANNKTGFLYYSIDTDRYQDIKIKRLKKDFGTSGIAVYDYILCEIYRVQGCFLVWDESTAFDVADYFGLKETLVNEIVNYCGTVGLFNKELLAGGSKNLNESNRGDACGESRIHTCGGIITSRSIQKRYMDMSSRAKRKDFKIPEEIDIITEECKIIPEESPKVPEVCDKVKESKRECVSPIIPIDEDVKASIGTSQIKELLLLELPWKEQMCQQSGFSIEFMDMLPGQIDNFLSWIQVIGEEKTLLKIEDAKRRFYYWWRDTGSKEWNQLNNIEDDKRGTKAFKPTSGTATRAVRSKVEEAADRNSSGASQKDYSERF